MLDESGSRRLMCLLDLAVMDEMLSKKGNARVSVFTS